MQDRKYADVGCADFKAQYDVHLARVRGLSQSTRNLHGLVVHKLLAATFPSGRIVWRDFHFQDVVRFVSGEFRRLHSRETQRAWLMVLRSVLRYLAEEEHIAAGWDAALPPIANPRHAQLPRGLSEDQVRALWRASEGKSRRDLRNRALLLLFLRLGLRTEEVAALVPGDIDWKNGTVKIRSAKTYRERTLPLPQDVGEALIAYLRTLRAQPRRLFDPTRKAPIGSPRRPEQRYEVYVRNCMWYLFQCAGIRSHGPHTVRHTLATGMVNSGATFKAVSDMLGHKSITTTLIYAKLDLKALMQVALPWPSAPRTNPPRRTRGSRSGGAR
jgi:site-specific recombinase XerD